MKKVLSIVMLAIVVILGSSEITRAQENNKFNVDINVNDCQRVDRWSENYNYYNKCSDGNKFKIPQEIWENYSATYSVEGATFDSKNLIIERGADICIETKKGPVTVAHVADGGRISNMLLGINETKDKASASPTPYDFPKPNLVKTDDVPKTFIPKDSSPNP